MTTSRRKHRSRPVRTGEPQIVNQPVRSEKPAPSDPSKETKSIETLDLEFAGPLRRVYAFAIDIGILLMVIFVVGPIFGTSEGIFNIFGIQTGIIDVFIINVPNIPPGIIDVFVFLAYFILPTGIWGRTIGKWVAGIQVVDDEGNKPGVALAIPREMVGRFVATITFGIGLIWVIFDEKHQGWHDKMAGTYVVVVPNSGGPGFLARMFAPQDDKRKSEDNRRQRVGRPTTRRRRRSNRRRG